MRDAILRQRAAQTGVADRSLHRLAVGFVDLVGFTPLSLRTSPARLLGLISQFEAKAFEVASRHNGRIVKHIGDEVMFVALDAGAGCAIARDITAAYSEGIEPRGGVAFGDVITRHGDYYGTVVNLASRLAELAVPGEVLVDGAGGLVRRQSVRLPAGRPAAAQGIRRAPRGVLAGHGATEPYRRVRHHPGLNPPFRYRSPDEDSGRWVGFPFRDWRHRNQHPLEERDHLGPDDLRPAHLPAHRNCRTTLSRLSPWLDWLGYSRGRRSTPCSRAQRHRRFIKTHTPLDGIPIDPRCTLHRHHAGSSGHGGVPLPPGGQSRSGTDPAAPGSVPSRRTPPDRRPPLHEWLL